MRLCLLPLALLASIALAAGDPTAEEMQRQLNAEVLASEFNAGDVAKAQAAADEAMKKDLQPVTRPPNYWQPGWTCSHLTRSRYYRYADYRDCVYYHRYYGRYW